MYIRNSSMPALAMGLAFGLFASVALAADPPTTPSVEPAPATEQTEKQPERPRAEGRRAGEGRRPRGEGNDQQELTPEQRRKLALSFHNEVVAGLTTAQEDQILVIIDQIRTEQRTVAADPNLTREQKAAHNAKVHTDWYKYFLPVFNETQRAEWVEYHIAQHALIESPGGQLGELKPQERREEKRARLIAGYEEILDELSVKKKSEVLAALASEEEAIEAATSNTAFTAKQREEAITKAQSQATTKIDAQLTADQRKQWRKAKQTRAMKSVPVPIIAEERTKTN